MRVSRLTLESVAPWLAGLLLALPIVVVRYPPMGDLPMHEALVAILRYRGDPSWAPPGLYEVVAPQANQLFHWLAVLLSFVCGTALACQLVVAGIVLFTPVALARLLAQLQLSRWPALLGAPIAVGWTFVWGLAPNLLGFVLFIAGLPLLEQLARRLTGRRVLVAALAATAIFFAHESSALLFAVVALYLAVVRGGAPKTLALRALPALVTLALAVIESRIAAPLRGASMDAIGNDYGLDPIERLAILPGAVFGTSRTARLAIMSVVWLAAAIASAVARGRPPSGTIPVRLALWRYRYGVLAALFLFAYVGFPMSLAGNTLLAHRFLPAACVCLAVAVAPRRGRAPLILRVLVSVVPIAMLGASWKELRDADQSYRDLDAVVAEVPDDVAVAQLDLTPTGPKLVAPVPGATNRVLSAHGGRMLFSFVDLPPNPVYTRRDAQWREPILRLVGSPYAFMPAWDLQRFSYLLTRNTATERWQAVLTRALAPEAELVASRGVWSLYRSTLPIDPIDSPDRSLPPEPPETLAARVTRLRTTPAR